MSLVKKTPIAILMALALVLLTLAWTFPHLGVLIIPAFVLLLDISKRSGPRFWRLYLVTALWNATTTYWIANAHPLGVIATVGINGALMAFAIWFSARAEELLWRFPSFRSQRWLHVLPLVACWISFEQLHEYWGLAFPWLHLGNTFNGMPYLVQWYQFLGTTGGTLWVLLVAYTLHMRGTTSKRALWLFITPALLSLVLWYVPQNEDARRIRVAVIQPNIDAYTEKWEVPEAAQIQKVDRLLRTHLGEKQVDLIVLPETFLPEAREESNYGNRPNDRLLLELLDTYCTSAIFGATTYDFQQTPDVFNRPYGDKYYTLYNTALFRNSAAETALYHKGKLVVGGETMPFVQLLKPYLGDWAIELGGTSGTLGVSQRRTVFEDERTGLKLAPVICWENEFSDYATEYARSGANLIAVITNDGWWGNTVGHLQHLRFSGLRAIEQGKYVVRSANTGVSSIIDEKGRVLRRLDWDTEGVILSDVPLLESKTLYVRTGNWIGKVAVVLFALLVLVILFSRFFRLKPR